MPLTRRDLVDLAVRAAALPGAAHFFSTWLEAADSHQHSPGTGAPPEPPLLAHYEPRFFSPEDFDALQSFTEILIPTDETPGARDAHCAHFIDFVMQSATELPQMQKPWRDAMSALREAGFHAANPSQRAALMEQIARPERDPSAKHPAYSAYRLIKQQNAFAFFTSRAGMIQMLNYKGNSYNVTFPACEHPEHQVI